MSTLPVARTEGLVTTHTGDDLLVYDQISKELHTLKPRVATVWPMCDGTRSVESLAAASGETPEMVSHILDALTRVRLIDNFSHPPTHVAMSRRRLARNAAGAGVAGALIISTTAPAAAAITSCVPYSLAYGEECKPEGDCCLQMYSCQRVGARYECG